MVNRKVQEETKQRINSQNDSHERLVMKDFKTWPFANENKLRNTNAFIIIVLNLCQCANSTRNSLALWGVEYKQFADISYYLLCSSNSVTLNSTIRNNKKYKTFA